MEACELHIFEPKVAMVFENAIERLFYSDSFRTGNATLPQRHVRSRLHLLNWMILDNAREKLCSNLGRQVKNSTAYVMATIFNCITESESDLMVDPYLKSLDASSAPVSDGENMPSDNSTMVLPGNDDAGRFAMEVSGKLLQRGTTPKEASSLPAHSESLEAAASPESAGIFSFGSVDPPAAFRESNGIPGGNSNIPLKTGPPGSDQHGLFDHTSTK